MWYHNNKNTYRPFLSEDVTRWPHNWNDDDSSWDDDGSTQLNHPPPLTHSHSLHHSHNNNNIISSLGAGVETKTIISANIVLGEKLFVEMLVKNIYAKNFA
jgi:hypothetical protein